MSGLTKNKLTKQDIEKIIQLRKDGMSLLKIAKKFDIDHTTVMYHLRKFERVGSVEVQQFWRRIEVEKKMGRKTGVNGRNKGKTYKQYLNESNNRNKKISDLVIPTRRKN